MARPLRITYPGAFYHITSRGNERKNDSSSCVAHKLFYRGEIMGMAIREIRKEDLQEAKAIFKEFVSYHEQRDNIFDKIVSADHMWGDYVYGSHTHDEKCQVLVAELDGFIVGYCVGRIEEKPPIYKEKVIGVVGNIAVKEGYKRQGIGEQLFTTIKGWFKSHSVDHIEIEAATSNPQSTSFWMKMGGREFIKRMELRI